MAYRLVENKGDSVAVPQLVIAKLPELEDDWLRVALFVVATGETDPARIAAALRLKSPERAQTALVYWKGAGLLESCGEPQARGGIDAAPAPRAHLTTPEVASAAQGDPAIAGLVQECQALMGGVITQADTNILVSMYLSDGMPVDMILLGVAHFAALGKRSARYIERALLGWQREGIDSGEAAERYLRLLDQRAAHEKETAKLLGLADAKFTKADSRAIATTTDLEGLTQVAVPVTMENFSAEDAPMFLIPSYAARYVSSVLDAKEALTVGITDHELIFSAHGLLVSCPACKAEFLDPSMILRRLKPCYSALVEREAFCNALHSLTVSAKDPRATVDLGLTDDSLTLKCADLFSRTSTNIAATAARPTPHVFYYREDILEKAVQTLQGSVIRIGIDRAEFSYTAF